MSRDDFNNNNNYVVVLNGITKVTLAPNQQLVTPGTVQVATSAETIDSSRTTTHIIK